MATANPTLIHRKYDNYEIELRRVREKIRAQFGDLTDRLKCRERELLDELDVILASHRSYQTDFEGVRDKVRDLKSMKQRNEEELTTSRSKKLQENIIKQIEEEIQSITYPKQPQLVSFVCETNVTFSEIDKLGKLVTPTGKDRLGELMMKVGSVTTEPTRARNLIVGPLSTPISSTIIDDKIIYEANDSFSFLSNCYQASFKLDGKEWPTVLHYFVAKKFDMKKHHVSNILSLKSCEEVHLYSRNSSQSDIVTYWDMDKKGVMKKALKAKFEQNPLLRENILKTGRSEIIERSTNDQYWSQLASGSGRNVMGDLLCEVRDDLNTRPSTPPNSFSTKWESFEAKASKTISTVIPSSPKTTDSHLSSKRLSQPTNTSSYKFDNILSDTTVNDLTRNLSRTEINSSNTVKASDTIHYTDFVNTGVYHDFSTYSIHGFTLDGEYWKSVQHYFQAQKYSDRWLRDEIRFAATSKKANEIGKDKTNRKYIVKDWDSIQEEVMFIALKAKFLKHVTLRDSLLATGDRLIVNDSENEFWGCGKDEKGNNKLGMLLMRIRSEYLKAVDSKSSLQTNHTSTSYPNSHPTSPLKSASNHDVIEFFDKDKAYFEFTPYSSHSLFLDDILWKTLNHYFQAQKFTSNKEKRKIADALTADRATYNANNELKRFSKTQTFNEKEKIMERGLEAKFTQHPDLRRKLLATGTRKLLFIHPEDIFWGTGTPKSIGQNKLGELLMDLRDKLRVPLPSTEPKFVPKNIPHTNSNPCSSEDDNTSHQRNVKGQVPYLNKSISTPPEVTPHRRSYLSILTILLLVKLC